VSKLIDIALVGIIIIVVMIVANIEKPVSAQFDRLMKLEI
jgi:hypothetical protein